MRREFMALIAVPALSLLAFGAAAEMYKWVDENGQTHYTQEPPPPGIAGSEIRPQAAPPATESAQESLRKLQERVDGRLEEREKGKKTASEDAAHAAEKQKRCEAARQRLEKAERPRTNFVDPDGTQRRATEEERLEQIKQSEKQVAEFCGT